MSVLWGAVAVAAMALGGCGAGTDAGANGPEGSGEERATAPPETGTPAGQETGGGAEVADRWSPPRFRERREERDRMVQVIRGYDLDDRAVLEAMAAVPRHAFVPAPYQSSAYADTPLPIGHGQTISQPYIVAEMTRQLQLKPDSRVLEIGTGSGYQAAVLTEFTRHVYSVEIVKPLAEAAQKRLRRLGYGVVRVRHGDGYFGWPLKEGEKPFDGIIVTCAAGQVPPPLLKQLAPGGRMVIPVGPVYAPQSLMLVEKDADGTVRSRSLMGVRFVPLIRQDPTSH